MPGTKRNSSAPQTRESKKIAREKKRRRQRRRRVVTLLVVILAVLVVLSLTVFFRIDTVKVEGHSQYTEQQIINASGVEKGDNLFRLRKSTVSERIQKNLPYLGEVTIVRSLPNTLILRVSDATFYAAIQQGSKYYITNEDGILMAEAQDRNELEHLVLEQVTRQQAAAKKTATTASATSGTGTEVSGSGSSTSAVSTGTSAVSTGTAASSTRSNLGMIFFIPAHAVSSSGVFGGGAAYATTSRASSVSTTSAPTTTRAATSSTSTTAATTKVTTTADPQAREKAMREIMIVKGLKVEKAEIGKELEIKEDSSSKLYDSIRSYLRQYGIKGVTGIDLTKKTELTFTYENRILVLLGDMQDLDGKIKLAKTVLDQQDSVSTERTGRLDVSIVGKAFFQSGELKDFEKAEKKKTTTTSTTTTTAPAVIATTAAPTTQAATRTTRNAHTVTGPVMRSQSW